MTVKTVDENYCWGCHKEMTSEEYADHHTYHDDVCCLEEPEAREEGNAYCLGLNTHPWCCPICHPDSPTLTGPHDGFFPTAEELTAVPGLYETERTPLDDKVIHLHYCVGGANGGWLSTPPRSAWASATPASATPPAPSGAT